MEKVKKKKNSSRTSTPRRPLEFVFVKLFKLIIKTMQSRTLSLVLNVVASQKISLFLIM